MLKMKQLIFIAYKRRVKKKMNEKLKINRLNVTFWGQKLSHKTCYYIEGDKKIYH